MVGQAGELVGVARAARPFLARRQVARARRNWRSENPAKPTSAKAMPTMSGVSRFMACIIG